MFQAASGRVKRSIDMAASVFSPDARGPPSQRGDTGVPRYPLSVHFYLCGYLADRVCDHRAMNMLINLF